MSITEDRVLPKGGFQLGFRYLYTDMGGQGYGTDSLTVNQVLSLFDVSPSGLASQSFALDLVYGLADRITLSATGKIDVSDGFCSIDTADACTTNADCDEGVCPDGRCVVLRRCWYLFIIFTCWPCLYRIRRNITSWESGI